jgi:hypothetical protein
MIAAFIGVAGAASGLLLSANNPTVEIEVSWLVGAPPTARPVEVAIEPAQASALDVAPTDRHAAHRKRRHRAWNSGP